MRLKPTRSSRPVSVHVPNLRASPTIASYLRKNPALPIRTGSQFRRADTTAVTQALMLACSVPDLGRTPLKPVSVPAAVTDFDITVPMDVLRDRLGSHFPLPANAAIELLTDESSGQAAPLRLLPG